MKDSSTSPPFIAPDVQIILRLNSEKDDGQKTEVQLGLEALAALGKLDDPELVDVLRSKWNGLTPAEQLVVWSAMPDFRPDESRTTSTGNGKRTPRQRAAKAVSPKKPTPRKKAAKKKLTTRKR